MRADFIPTSRAHPEAASHLHTPDSGRPIRRPRTPQRTTADRLRDGLMTLCEHRGQVITHGEKAWASITFSGARHTLALVFAGGEAVEAGERFIAALPDHEFSIPGQLVADATITEAEHRLLPTPRLVVQCELLLLEEG